MTSTKPDYAGLTAEEVTQSRSIHGRNVLTPPRKESPFKLFLLKFTDPLIVILLIAGVLSIGISFYEHYCLGKSMEVFIEPVGIFIAIILATGLSFIFEYRAEKEFAVLNKVSDEELVQVVRDGRHTSIPRADVVVGDIIVIDTGDEIPADAQLLQSVTLSVDESTLTGEPLAHKSHIPQAESDATYPPDVILRGTKVLEGNGIARVTAVGDATENGKVFTETRIDRSVVTPLNRQLNRLGHLISVTSNIIAALVVAGRIVMYFTSSSATAFDWIDFLAYLLQSLMLAVTLVVVAVPEGLPMAVTLSLAYSMRRMLHTGNLVRKMHACETMGAVTVICTDKTGTLTRNLMSVDEMLIPKPSQQSMKMLIDNIAINSTANIDFSQPDSPKILGNPTEGALLIWLAEKHPEISVDNLRSIHISDRLPFSTENKYMATTCRLDDGSTATLLKGAPEIVLRFCDIDDTTLQTVTDALRQMQNRAMRTLAFAWKDGIEDFSDHRIASTGGYNFIAIAAIADPVRADVPPAIKECLDAGIAVKVITGDTPATAREIATQIGLWNADDSADAIVEGTEVEALSDSQLAERVDSIKIVARARPGDKRRIVEALQKSGNVVAVTGDGTNDAPALKAAHVGLAMGSGTAVAKEASDITILTDSFVGISDAVMWGRSLYRNIRRFILFQLTVNVAACLTVLVGAFMGIDPPLTVTQMLWVNLVMDTFAAMALASLPPSRDVMNLPPRRTGEFIISAPMARFICGIGLIFAIVMIAILAIMEHTTLHSLPNIFHPVISSYKGMSPYEHGLFFTFFVMLQWWNLFNARAFGSCRSAFNLRHCSEFILILLVIFVGQILISSFGGEFFNLSSLSVSDWVTIVLLCSPVIIIGEICRTIYRHRRPVI